MMKRICRVCGEEFFPAIKHPGYINVCLEEDCRSVARTPYVKLVREMSDVSLVINNKKKRLQQVLDW